jgi:hypothetical protein
MTPRWGETAAGWALNAYGIAEPDPADLVTRGEEIRRQVDLSHRQSFRSGQEMSDEAAFTAASAERGVGVIFPVTDGEEWRRRMRRTHPLWVEDGCMTLAEGVVIHGRDPKTGAAVRIGGSPEVRERVRLAGQRGPQGGMQQGVLTVHWTGRMP